jgi:hypothetical protein
MRKLRILNQKKVDNVECASIRRYKGKSPTVMDRKQEREWRRNARGKKM